MLDRLKSICVSAKKPIVRIASWTSVATAPTRELPFEAEPDVDHDADDGEQQSPSAPVQASSPETRGPTTSTRRYS